VGILFSVLCLKMDNEPVFRTEESTENVSQPPEVSVKKSSSKSKLIILIAGFVVLMLLIGGGSYFLGKRSNSSENPSPTPAPTQTPEPTEIISSPTPTATASGSITPTKKLLSTNTPTSSPTPIPKSKLLSSSTSLDGFRSSNNGGNATLEIRAGRNVNLVTRGFVSFDLSDIPSGATITEASLRLYQAKIIGNPYGAGGSLKVDHLTYGDSLDNEDYGAAALSSSFITLTNNASIEWKDAVVTDRVKDDIANGRSRSQFRIHFQTENTGGDVTGDFAYFEAAENNMATGNTPQLVIKYY